MPVNNSFAGAAMQAVQGNGYTVFGPQTASPIFGTLTYVIVPTGTPWFSESTGYPPIFQTGRINPEVVLEANGVNQRIISAGFEVTNTTADLYKSGSCTVFSTFQGDYETQMVNSFQGIQYVPVTGTTLNAFGLIRNFRLPPQSLSQAQQTPGARTWPAVQGCYVPARLNLSRIKPNFGNNLIPVFWGPGAVANPYVIGCAATATNSGANANGTAYPLQDNMESGLHCSGAVFSGLTPQSTLLLTANITVETFPTSDVNELALASPTAVYDPIALALYEETIYRTPVGCPQTDNPTGEWWKEIGKGLWAAAKVAIPEVVGKVIPFSDVLIKPALNAVESAVTALDDTARNNKAWKDSTERNQPKKKVDKKIEKAAKKITKMAIQEEKPKLVLRPSRRPVGKGRK